MGFNLVHLVCTTTLASLLFAAAVFGPNAAAAHEVMILQLIHGTRTHRCDERTPRANKLVGETQCSLSSIILVLLIDQTFIEQSGFTFSI